MAVTVPGGRYGTPDGRVIDANGNELEAATPAASAPPPAEETAPEKVAPRKRAAKPKPKK